MKYFQRKIHTIITVICVAAQILVLSGSTYTVGNAAPVQQASPFEKAEAQLSTMSPEEKVGQLFLVSFQGTDTSPESAIYELITNYHIGGVVLQAQNDNFVGPEETAENALSLIRDLQEQKWLASQQPFIRSDTQSVHNPEFAPLFIGISQDGDGYPHDQIINGLTNLPNQMSIGATWRPDLAEKVGEVLGRELSALGINLLFGPSLDVLEAPKPESSGDFGTRSFGGDPYWVGKMGRAFIRGAHNGSQNRLAVVAKHFPGNGGANRPLEEEIPTVRKSLEQLKQIELAPFFAVTGEAPDLEGVTDGLLVTHIRYQGFQGNIRATTRPVSLDQQALSQLINLPRFTSWRENGGIVVSDDLSLGGLRRLLDPDALSFNPRLLTRDAFLAGNDLLFLGNILDPNDPDSFTTTTRIIEFFVNKYNEDLAFAQRVDESILRILTLKFKLYTTFSLGEVLSPRTNLQMLGGQSDLVFEVALGSATLISPTTVEIENVLPNAPGINDRIVFITDAYSYRQCSTCPEQYTMDPTALQQAVLRLYGPSADGLVLDRNLSSFTFADLNAFLDNPSENPGLQTRLQSANWIVFSMLRINPNRQASLALRRFLSERIDLTQQKQIISFAFNAPYYLDATDISKLTAYYGLFSKTPQTIDIAARILFKEIKSFSGNLPVSVSGIGYELISATSPDPDQIILVELDQINETDPPQPQTPEPTPILLLQPGEVIPIRTGLIIDHNGNPVPDGTLVLFLLRQSGEETRLAQVETTQGIARTTLQIPQSGPIEIYAISEPAIQSSPLRIEIPVQEKSPTIAPSETPEDTPTPAPTSTIEPTAPTVTPAPLPPIEPTQADSIDWLLATLVAVFLGLLAYRLGTASGHIRWSVRWGLTATIGGALTYTYISMRLPGSNVLLNSSGRWGILWSILVGCGVGWAVSLVWQLFETKQGPPQSNRDSDSH